MKKWESVTTKTIKAFPDGKHCHNNKKKKNRIWNRNKRQKTIEKQLKCRFIWINADAKKYDIFIEIGKIHNHSIESIKKLAKESTKKSLIDDLSKKLLELKFKSNNSKKSKWLDHLLFEVQKDYRECRFKRVKNRKWYMR